MVYRSRQGAARGMGQDAGSWALDRVHTLQRILLWRIATAVENPCLFRYTVVFLYQLAGIRMSHKGMLDRNVERGLGQFFWRF